MAMTGSGARGAYTDSPETTAASGPLVGRGGETSLSRPTRGRAGTALSATRWHWRARGSCGGPRGSVLLDGASGEKEMHTPDGRGGGVGDEFGVGG